jgi:hypothetical protein
MTSKERMMLALGMQKPDRLPVTIHQWQDFHLVHYMDGLSDIDAFLATGLDMAITRYPFIHPKSPDWKIEAGKVHGENNLTEFSVATPRGTLNWQTGTNEYTTWVTENMIKNDEDIYLYRDYSPVPSIDKKVFQDTWDTIGDNGILRSFLNGYQGGCWQDACELYGTEKLIYATFDKPGWVHEFLGILLDKKLRFIYEYLKGSKIDLVETGGGASSSTVVSPDLHREFCLPYDRKLHDAIHSIGLPVVYHTCGGMLGILDSIAANACDASETLSPPGVGGDVVDPHDITDVLGGKLALIGGMDQINILENASATQIREEVQRLFRGFGLQGGYILSASDHFFHAPRENIMEFSRSARDCVY